MLRVYCDSGAYRQELRDYEREGLLTVHQFKYENRNRHIRHGAVPSRPTWKEMNYTWDEMRKTEEFRSVTWDSLGEQSPKFLEIAAIVGPENVRDAKHLDSAYATGCTVFLTSDKADIWSKRGQLKEATGMIVMHVQVDWPAFLELVRSDG